jgi:hypothetical protein
MSHLSRIKTTINNGSILKDTLNELDIKWSPVSLIGHQSNDLRVIHNSTSTDIGIFSWRHDTYEFIADLQLWRDKVLVDSLLETIHQQYAYKIISKESIILGFNSTGLKTLEDGSIHMVLEKWTNQY